jgi:hypothetical protein
MGKRELLLIVAFLVLGGVIYQVSAPDVPSSGRRSWDAVFREIRSGMFGSRARHPVDLAVNLEVGPGTSTLDLGQLSGRVEIVGEDRATIEGTAHATLVGEDAADVARAAEALQIAADRDGDRLRVRLSHPDEWRLGRQGRPAVDLRLKVPARLAVALGVAGVVEAQGVAGVSLDTARGNVTLRRIAGPVEGDQRDGMLEISGARSLDLETRRVTLRLEGIDGDVKVEAVDGGIDARGLKGRTTLDTRRATLEVSGQSGLLEIEGQDGRVEVRGLTAELRFDGTRLPLRVEMAAAVPVTVESTEGAIDVLLPPGGVTLKAEADEGSVQAPPELPAPTRTGLKTTLEAEVRGGGPLVSLTGTRAAITVRTP